MAAIGAPISTIDFETLPDGSPSHGGVYITPSFNYTKQGLTFFSPLIPPNYPYGLTVLSPNSSRGWLIADLMAPNRAVGIFGGGTTLYAYDAQGAAWERFGATPGLSGHHLRRADCAGDRGPGSGRRRLGEFAFSAIIPEPASALLLLLGASLVGRRRRAQ